MKKKKKKCERNGTTIENPAKSIFENVENFTKTIWREKEKDRMSNRFVNFWKRKLMDVQFHILEYSYFPMLVSSVSNCNIHFLYSHNGYTIFHLLPIYLFCRLSKKTESRGRKKCIFHPILSFTVWLVYLMGSHFFLLCYIYTIYKY